MILRNEINEAINKLKDDGTLEILKQKWWIKIDECPVLTSQEDVKFKILFENDLNKK